MPILSGLAEKLPSLIYIGSIEALPRLDAPEDTKWEFEAWDVYLTHDKASLLVHYGPLPKDYLCGDRDHWEGLQQVGSRSRSNYPVSIADLKLGYDRALELLERRGFELL